MIPDIQSCLLCDDVRQERNGKFILIGLFDAIGAATFPLKYPRLFLVTRWCTGEGEFTQKSVILKPDQTTILVKGREIPVKLPNSERTATNVELLMNVEFDKPGTYWVEVSIDNTLKLRYPLRVNKVKPQPGQQGQPGQPGFGQPPQTPPPNPPA